MEILSILFYYYYYISPILDLIETRKFLIEIPLLIYIITICYYLVKLAYVAWCCAYNRRRSFELLNLLYIQGEREERARPRGPLRFAGEGDNVAIPYSIMMG